MTEKISGGAFKQMVAFGAACITREKQAIIKHRKHINPIDIVGIK